MEELTTLAAQSFRIFELAKDVGIEPGWKLLVFMGSSWLLLEVARKIGVKGGCAGWKCLANAWKWAMSEKALVNFEQTILDAVTVGTWEEMGRIQGDDQANEVHRCVVSVDGRVVAQRWEVGRPNVWLDGDDVAVALSARVLKKIDAVLIHKQKEDEDARVELEKDRARWKLYQLQHQPVKPNPKKS